MTPRYAARIISPTTSPEQLFGRFSPLDAVMRVAHELLAEAPAIELAIRAGVSPRAAEYWLSRHRDPSAENFIRLLASPEGPAFLNAALGDCAPAFWAPAERQFLTEDLRRRQDEILARLEALGRG
jgi:hypothetical protein